METTGQEAGQDRQPVVPAEWNGLGVEVETQRDWMSDRTIIAVRMRFDARKLVATLPMSNELLSAPAMDVDRLVFHELDKVFRPWMYPAVVPGYAVSLFPRWERMDRWWRRNRPRSLWHRFLDWRDARKWDGDENGWR